LQTALRPFWSRIFRFNWRFGLFLIIIICIPRFLLVLHANIIGSYGSIGLIMFISAVAPFLFLTKYGQREIGLVKPKTYSWLLLAFIAGLLYSFLLYYVGEKLYDNSYSNWYHYIGKSYKIPGGINQHDKAVMFSVVAVTECYSVRLAKNFFSGELFTPALQNRLAKKKLQSLMAVRLQSHTLLILD